MKHFIGLIILLLVQIISFAQVVFIVESVPANTPLDEGIFIAGSFNSWAAGNPAFELTELIDGKKSITLNISGNIQCKFTRGTWESVEGNASGNYLPDRTYQVAPGDTISIVILSWEDLSGSSGQSTALETVSILSNAFNIPQLQRTRRIWICLPIDYEQQPEKSYPVIYMQDGQNLFDSQTSFSGEWGLDESMRDLMLAGDYGAIIVGIDNGGSERLNEYSPWNNPAYGGGQGDLYALFLKETLKPYIDNNFRTLSNAENTAIGGSSMGGLIALYCFAKYPETFGKAAIFSPAYWFARNPLFNYLDNLDLEPTLKIYSVAGTNESVSMMPDIAQVNERLSNSGVPDSMRLVAGFSDGAHSEWFWRREFPAAYQWLFSGEPEVPTSAPSLLFELQTKVFPNPFDSYLQIQFAQETVSSYLITDLSGREISKGDLTHSQTQIDTSFLKRGTYFVTLYRAGNKLDVKRIVKF
jgi:metallo-beta-lactamase class B